MVPLQISELRISGHTLLEWDSTVSWNWVSDSRACTLHPHAWELTFVDQRTHGFEVSKDSFGFEVSKDSFGFEVSKDSF